MVIPYTYQFDWFHLCSGWLPVYIWRRDMGWAYMGHILVLDKEAIQRKWLLFPMSAPRCLEKPPGVTDCSLATGGFWGTEAWSEQLLIVSNTCHMESQLCWNNSHSALSIFDEKKYDREQPEKRMKQVLQKFHRDCLHSCLLCQPTCVLDISGAFQQRSQNLNELQTDPWLFCQVR